MKPIHDFANPLGLRALLFVFLLAPAAVALAQDNAGANAMGEPEAGQAVQNATDTIEGLQERLRAYDEQRKNQCLQAFGHAGFCGCVFDRMPVSINFFEYVYIAVNSKEENGYAKLNEGSKKAYDKALEIRETCIAETFQ